MDTQSPDPCRKHHLTTSDADAFFRRRRSKGRSLVPVRYVFDWSCCTRVEALGRIHFAGAPIVAMAMTMTMTDSLYIQAEAGCNAAATNVGRPTVRNWGTLRNRTKL